MGFPVTLLMVAVVAPSTQVSYMTQLRRLLVWLCLSRVGAWSAQTWDDHLTHFLEYLYDQGRPKGDASTVLSALRWAVPAIPRPLRVGLPLASASLAGWKAIEHGTSRPPAPRAAAIHIAWDCCQQGQALYGFLFLLMFETYFRPSEALSLRCFQLIRPIAAAAGAYGMWTVMTRAYELEQPGKTGEFDVSVPLDLARHRVLLPALEVLVSRLHPQELVFHFSYDDMVRAWNDTLGRLKLSGMKLSPYSLRHGVASEDRAMNERSLLEVQKRGGWRCFQSVRRYEKHGRLALTAKGMPANMFANTARVEAALAGALARGV